MKIIFIISLLLTACTKTPSPTDLQTRAVINRVEALQKSVKVSKCPKQEQNALINDITAIKSEIGNISLICQTEKAVLTAEIKRYKTFITLLIVLFLSVFIMFIKFK